MTPQLALVYGPDALSAERLSERRARYRAGLVAEVIAAVLLFAKGYRILAWRHKTRAGEIDLVAVRGNLLAFVEVKRRRDRETAAASITARQSRRLRQAADLWLARRPHRQGNDIRFDAVFVTPARLPLHVAGGA